MVVEEKKTWGQSRSLYLGGSAVLSEGPKIWRGWEAQKSRRSFEWKGIAFGTYKIRSEGVGACPWFQGGTGSVLRVSKVAARRRRQLWRSGDGGVG